MIRGVQSAGGYDTRRNMEEVKMMRKIETAAKGVLTAIVLAAAVILPTTLPAAEQAPGAQLESTIDNILGVLRDPGLRSADRGEERRERLRAIAGKRFDYRRMSQLSLGRHWKSRSEQEKTAFARRFTTLLEDTYMSRIEAYTDERVVFLTERISGKKAQINTKIITTDVEIPINYRMYRRKTGQWMVYDMVIEGVSMIGNYRSQFSQVLERHSFEELIERLRAGD